MNTAQSAQRLQAKVCGLARREDLLLAIECGADWLGFVRHAASPRHCTDLRITQAAPAACRARGVLVMVSDDVGEVIATAQAAGLAAVQPYLPALRASDAAATVRRLHGAGLRVLWPWPDEPHDAAPAPAADLFIWETSPAQTGVLGGSGQSHALAHPPPGPYLLAGGMDGDGLSQRLEALPLALRPLLRGADAASRLELAPGIKDAARLQHFVRSTHAFEF